MARLKTVVGFLDKALSVTEFADSSNNGLQVANSGRITRVCCGVDASMEFFEEARRRRADFLVCHHGISWDDSLKTITGLNYRRIAFLIKHDMALYACHLPLDAHPRYGNNALICRALGLRRRRRFGMHRGREVGFQGAFPRPVRYERFKRLVAKVTGSDVRSMDFGKKTVRTVAVVSGGAAGDTEEAGKQGVDVYLTGESALSAYNTAKEYGINVVFAGHYATEVFGVRALAGVLKRRFRVKTEFVDLGVRF